MTDPFFPDAEISFSISVLVTRTVSGGIFLTEDLPPHAANKRQIKKTGQDIFIVIVWFSYNTKFHYTKTNEIKEKVGELNQIYETTFSIKNSGHVLHRANASNFLKSLLGYCKSKNIFKCVCPASTGLQSLKYHQFGGPLLSNRPGFVPVLISAQAWTVDVF